MNKQEALEWLKEHGDYSVSLHYYECREDISVGKLFEIFKAALEPDEEDGKCCSTCKHEQNDVDEDPCFACSFHYSKWEAK